MTVGGGVRIACKRESVVITRFAPHEEIYAFDHAGRLFTAWRGNRLYRRALDGRVMEKYTDRRGRRPRKHRRFLDPVERSALIDDAAAAAADGLAALGRGTADVLWSMAGPEDRGAAYRLVAAASRFDGAAAEADRRRFEAVYTSVPILPPDRYLALVVQITEGCHWNQCTFCSFYREQRFRIKSLDEFARHVEGVAQYFGEGLTLRRGVFLGDANALLVPATELAPRLECLHRCLPRHADDLSAFIDVFTGHRRGTEDFAALRSRGLRRVYVGLESGTDKLLAFLNKPQTADEGVGLVRTMKSAGLAVGVIVMAGIGGRVYQERHIRDTAGALEGMQLGAGDLVYVSAFETPAGGPYAERARAGGIAPLGPDELADQVEELLRAAARVVGPGTRVAPYDIQEFLY